MGIDPELYEALVPRLAQWASVAPDLDVVSR
jgi:hypothetical protein